MKIPMHMALVMAGVLLASIHPAVAQTDFPKGPIRLVVPFPPAGATDAVSRLVADRIAATDKWQFVVDNRPGAGGNIGLDAVAKAKPDGYTLGMAQTANMAINPALYSNMPFDPLKDVVPVALVAEQPLVVVVPANSPARTLADLVAAARGRALTMASAGNGTVGHLAGELLARRAGMQVTHVPYKGAGAALTDLMGERIDFMLPTPQAALQLVKGGKLRALAVTSARRIPVLPEVPTVDESGFPDFVAIDWKVLVAPAGTPPAIIERIHAAVQTVLRQPETLDRLNADGSGPMQGSTAQIARFIKSEHTRWGGVVREAHVNLD